MMFSEILLAEHRAGNRGDDALKRGGCNSIITGQGFLHVFTAR